MGHYDDAYEYEHKQKRKARKVLLEQQLEDLKDFYMWKPDRPRMWEFNSEHTQLFMRIIKDIESELYNMRDI